MVVVREICEPQCQALNLSDGQRCAAEATAHDRLFCRFHAKQCFGLYMGYKRRNAELDALADNEPEFLRNSKASLASQTFEDLTSQSEVAEVHEYLFKQYVLLGKVIAARKIHHKHFYSLEMDYGHKAYLDKLVNTRHSVLKALETLERRTAQLLYKKEKWFDWVRQVQDDEDENREKVQKKIKLEAAMFRRHWREMEARLAAAREKEEKKRQEAYLEEVWRERMAAESGEESHDDAAWDPIEDVFEDDRGRYLDLIRHFLWMDVPATERDVVEPSSSPVPAGASRDSQDKAGGSGEQDAAEGGGDETPPGQIKKPRKWGGKKKKSKAGGGPETTNAVQPKQNAGKPSQEPGPNKSMIESKADVRTRLKEGVEKDYSHIDGPMFMLVGTIQNPEETATRTAPVKEEDAAQLIAEITEIKMLLFCRQIMSHSALLPAALRANSVEEFLSDPSIADSDLRDLCLKVEQPSLQALRDACADFVRGDETEDEGNADEQDNKADRWSVEEYIRHHYRYGDLEFHPLSDALSPLSRKALPGSDGLLGETETGRAPKEKKMKVKICGRSIWNYASQGSMARAGWLHFSIMAKDCTFEDAISLCRNWDEFFELNILTLWQYFPASKWTGWSGNHLTAELTQLGFVPFYMDFSAQQNTTYNHLTKVSRKVLRRQAIITEARNVVAAYMKRNDPVTRRFIQYALMRTNELFILVRDGKNGRIVVAPDEKHRWIVRSRRGTADTGYDGNEGWDVEIEAGPLLFTVAQLKGQCHFNFTEYYEVYIWDFKPGEKPLDMYHHIHDSLLKALRVRGVRDKLKHIKYIMGSLTREKDTMRVRQIKPGENVQSLYDELTGPNAEFYIKTNQGFAVRTKEDVPADISPYTFYNETDEAEDAVLFKEESLKNVPEDMPFVEITNPIRELEVMHSPLTLLNRNIEELARTLPPELEAALNLERARENKESRATLSYKPGAEQFPFAVPPIWEQAHRVIRDTVWDMGRTLLTVKLAFTSIKLKLTLDELTLAGKQEVMERDRSYVYKDSFHLADLEPGAQERYKESMRLIIGLQKYQSPRVRDHIDWAWFCMELLDWLHLKMYYDEYNPEVLSPWPHRYILQDIVQAFMMMGLFFPGVKETSIIQEYLDSEEGKSFRGSQIFDLASRCARRPDTRSRASCGKRPRKFWEQWDKIYAGDKYFVDAYPKDWAVAIRPIIAKLYRAGVITPAAREAVLVPGFATANTEPHRPGQLDLFIKYNNLHKYAEGLPPSYIEYKDYPQLLPAARKFAQGKPSARFALLRLWSAPHFYPLMMMLNSRGGTSFLDPAGRSWDWKFIPKDAPVSEWSIHNMVLLRLGYLREQLMGLGHDFETPRDKTRGPLWADTKFGGQDKFRHGWCELDERVVHRADLVLVMGEDERDLLKWCTAVTFALQTKPWLREVDLWKSFVNMDLEFLEELDPYWLE